MAFHTPVSTFVYGLSFMLRYNNKIYRNSKDEVARSLTFRALDLNKANLSSV